MNTSKGRVVNETDLIDALKKRTIAGTGLNVQATKPLLADSPLLELDNVIVTLHIASFTREAQTYCDLVVQEDVIRFAKGQPTRFVANPKS